MIFNIVAKKYQNLKNKIVQWGNWSNNNIQGICDSVV
ncbi:hypothetical protein MNBD_GAMMA18-1614 [hydrothermal vent metagenome]|uniref:Uncharacterized protein n=1 Tax=hydrothermal vent metagenome TaxID=652676 RepID=A0A3B0Z9V2_9ZZZZ